MIKRFLLQHILRNLKLSYVARKIRQELDFLNEEQLEKISDFIAFIQFQSQKFSDTSPLWEKLTPEARASEFQDWVSQLPETGVSLTDEVLSRDSIYEE